MTEQLTLEHFAGRVGQTFALRLDDGTAVEAELSTAEAWGGGAGPGNRVPFSLIFLGPLSPFLPQRIWRVEHPEVGSHDIFLVPLGPQEGRMRYQAVFS